jgi:hypothetical protein
MGDIIPREMRWRGTTHKSGTFSNNLALLGKVLPHTIAGDENSSLKHEHSRKWRPRLKFVPLFKTSLNQS